MSFNIQTIPPFEKEFKKLLKKYPSLKTDLSLLISSLEKKPIQGKALGNNFYKIRMSISSKQQRKRKKWRSKNYYFCKSGTTKNIFKCYIR